MKNKITTRLRYLFILACAGFSIMSCKDDDNSDSLRSIPGYVAAEGAVAQVRTIELKETESKQQDFFFMLRTKTKEDVEITFNYDESFVKEFNERKGKDCKIFPQELLNFTKTEVTIRAGNTSSDSVKVTFDYGTNALEVNKEYLIPVKASVKSGKVFVPEKDSYLGIVVKTVVNKTAKPNGIKVFSCVEINDTNPLNHLSFKLKESGKYLFDAVILFSPNMQYNEKTKKVHMSLNPKNRVLFDNIEKYVRPLQNEGIKVLFSVLPHHTAAGLSNLTDETCRAFAAELKKFNDKYGLDGVFFDDEYGYEGAAGDPGVLLPKPSKDAASRLAYETKKMMPDKWVTIYAYSHLISLNSVEGKKPGSFIDYIFPNYYVTEDYSPNFEGIDRNNVGCSSWNLSNILPWFESLFIKGLQSFKDGGFKTNMVFGLEPGDYIVYKQLEVLTRLTQSYFGEELIYDGIVYPSDWRNINGDPEEWTGE